MRITGFNLKTNKAIINLKYPKEEEEKERNVKGDQNHANSKQFAFES